MKFDRPLIALLIGSLSTLAYEITTRILLYFGYGKYSFYQLDSLIVTMNRPNLFMGIIVGCLTGGFFASVFYYTLRSLNIDYIIIKSILFSLVLWLALEIVFTATIEGKYIGIRPISDYYIHSSGAVAFGALQGILFKQLLFRKSTI